MSRDLFLSFEPYFLCFGLFFGPKKSQNKLSPSMHKHPLLIIISMVKNQPKKCHELFKWLLIATKICRPKHTYGKRVGESNNKFKQYLEWSRRRRRRRKGNPGRNQESRTEQKQNWKRGHRWRKNQRFCLFLIFLRINDVIQSWC